MILTGPLRSFCNQSSPTTRLELGTRDIEGVRPNALQSQWCGRTNETKMLGGEPAGREEGSLMPSGPAKWAPSLGTARWPPEPSGCPEAFQHQLIGLGADLLSHLRI